MRALFAALGVALVFGSSARADQIDYFCLFANAAAAQADATMASVWSSASSAWDQSRVFSGVSVATPAALINGVSPITGYWMIVSSAVDVPALDSDAACVMKLDRDIAAQGGSFVAAASISGTNRTSITFAPVPAGSAYPRPLGQ
jgi:hypothetical protein